MSLVTTAGFEAVRQRPAQGGHQRRLARSDRTADADPQRGREWFRRQRGAPPNGRGPRLAARSAGAEATWDRRRDTQGERASAYPAAAISVAKGPRRTATAMASAASMGNRRTAAEAAPTRRWCTARRAASSAPSPAARATAPRTTGVVFPGALRQRREAPPGRSPQPPPQAPRRQAQRRRGAPGVGLGVEAASSPPRPRGSGEPGIADAGGRQPSRRGRLRGMRKEASPCTEPSATADSKPPEWAWPPPGKRPSAMRRAAIGSTVRTGCSAGRGAAPTPGRGPPGHRRCALRRWPGRPRSGVWRCSRAGRPCPGSACWRRPAGAG